MLYPGSPLKFTCWIPHLWCDDIWRWVCSSDGKEPACNTEHPGSVPGSGGSSGEGNGNALQYSCLENPMDRGAWRATVHEVAQSQTRLTNTTLHYYRVMRMEPLDGWEGPPKGKGASEWQKTSNLVRTTDSSTGTAGWTVAVPQSFTIPDGMAFQGITLRQSISWSSASIGNIS